MVNGYFFDDVVSEFTCYFFYKKIIRVNERLTIHHYTLTIKKVISLFLGEGQGLYKRGF